VSKDGKTPEAREDADAKADADADAKASASAKADAKASASAEASADAEASASAEASADADASAGDDATERADTKADEDGEEAAAVARAEAASAPDEIEVEPSRASAEDDVGDPAFDALWARVVEAWGDDKPHGAIVEYAIRTHKLPELAGRYKGLTADPEKGERAKKRLDGVVIAATHLLYSTKTSKPTKTPWQWTLTVGLICAVIVSWLAYRILVSRVH
jgi:hypothetical protein